MKRNLVGKILGKIKIFEQDFVPIRTALSRVCLKEKSECVGSSGSFYFSLIFHNMYLLSSEPVTTEGVRVSWTSTDIRRY